MPTTGLLNEFGSLHWVLAVAGILVTDGCRSGASCSESATECWALLLVASHGSKGSEVGAILTWGVHWGRSEVVLERLCWLEMLSRVV